MVSGRTYDIFLPLQAALILANSADSDVMQDNDAFRLDLHCLLENPLRVFQYTKVHSFV